MDGITTTGRWTRGRGSMFARTVSNRHAELRREWEGIDDTIFIAKTTGDGE
jgi:hypothetical protein